MTEPRDLKARVLDILRYHRGRALAIEGKRIAQALREGDDRRIRQAIREIIAEGWPIASATTGPKGFFIAQTEEEARAYAGTLRSRLVEDALRRRDFLRAFQRNRKETAPMAPVQGQLI